MATKAGDIFISMAADFARFRDDMVKVGKLVNEQVGGMKADLESISGSIEGLKHGFEGLIAALGVASWSASSPRLSRRRRKSRTKPTRPA